MVSPYVKSGIVIGVGLVVIILASTLGWILVPDIIVSQVQLRDGTEAYKAWKIPPVPISMKFYLFHCKNPDAVLSGTEIPDLQQIGPFVFREAREKIIISHKDDQITYKDMHYYFDEGASLVSMDTNITTLNPIYLTLASLIAESSLSDLMKGLASRLVERELTQTAKDTFPFMTHTAEETLFLGWNISGYIDLIEKVNDTLGNTLPSLPEDFIDNPRFGLFFGRNATDDGLYTVNTGEHELNQLGTITSWRNSSSLPFWNDTYCDMINGTDGATYPPMLDKNKRIYIYTSDLCRSIYGTYEKDVEEQGIKAYRFTIPKIVFGNYTENPDNRCYCRSENHDECFSAGILDLRSCQSGIPILMSTPHFYMGDEKYVNAVQGLKPAKEKHETHFDIEPTTGAPVFAEKRIQINFDLRKYFMPKLNNIKPTVFPIMWVEEGAKLDKATADDLKGLFQLVNGLDIGRWTVLAVGIALVLVGTIITAIYIKKRKRTV